MKEFFNNLVFITRSTNYVQILYITTFWVKISIESKRSKSLKSIKINIYDCGFPIKRKKNLLM